MTCLLFSLLLTPVMLLGGQDGLAQDPSSELERLRLEGLSALDRNDYAEALRVLELGLQQARLLNDQSYVSRFLNNLGITYDSLGKYSEAFEHLEQALATARQIDNGTVSSIALFNMGNLHLRLGQYPEAQEHFEQALAVKRATGERASEEEMLTVFGRVYLRLGRYVKLMELFEQALAAHRANDDRAGEGADLAGLGDAYLAAAQYSKAEDHFRQALAIHRAIGDRASEGKDLRGLGNAHLGLRQHSKAQEHFEQALTVHREMGDRVGEGNDLVGLGDMYSSLDRYADARVQYGEVLHMLAKTGDQEGLGNTWRGYGIADWREGGDHGDFAEGHLESAIKSHRGAGDRVGEGKDLSVLGDIYLSRDQYSKAQEQYERAIAIWQETDDRTAEGDTLTSLGVTYCHLDKHAQALEHFEQALVIHQAIGDQTREVEDLAGLGDAYLGLTRYSEAEDHYQQALAIHRAINDRAGEASDLRGIGNAYSGLGRYDEARAHFEQALAVHREMGERAGEAGDLAEIGDVYLSLGEDAQARDHYQESRAIRRAIDDGTDEWKTLRSLATAYRRLGRRTCFADDTEAKSPPARVRVDLDLPPDGKVRAGGSVRVRWEFQPGTKGNCPTPLYLVLTTPERVHSRGEEFFALPPGALGPFGLTYQQQRTRVFVPLHTGEWIWSGELDIQLFQAGSATLDWALVEVPIQTDPKTDASDFAVGEWVAVPGSAGDRSLSLLPGPPQVAVQDLYSTEQPKEIVYSNSGEFVLKIYENHYQVLDRKTGNLIVEREGTEPNFSPTSRYVGARADNHDRFDVIDLRVGEYTPSIQSVGMSDRKDFQDGVYYTGAIAWGADDAFFVVGSYFWGEAAVRFPLIDHWVSPAKCGGHNYRGWAYDVHVDIENAVVWYCGGREDSESLLGGQASKAKRDTITGGAVQTKPPFLMRDRPVISTTDTDYYNEAAWTESGALQVSHLPESSKEALTSVYVPHTRDPSPADIAQAVDTLSLTRGRAVLGEGRGVVPTDWELKEPNGLTATGTMASRLVERLADFGLDFARMALKEEYDFPENYETVHLQSKAAQLQRLFPEMDSLVFYRDDVGRGCPGHTPGYPVPDNRTISVPALRRVWKWANNGRVTLLFQSFCQEGTANDGFGWLTLFSQMGSGAWNLQRIDPSGVSEKSSAGQSSKDASESEAADTGIVMAPLTQDLGLDQQRRATTWRVDVAKQRFLLFAGYNNTVLVYDVETQSPRAYLEEVPAGDLISALRLTADGENLVQINSDGRFYLYNLSSQERILNGYYLDDEIVLFTDEGYYWATSEGAHFVFLRFPGISGFHSFSQFEKTLDRPDVIQGVLRSRQSSRTVPEVNAPPATQLEVVIDTERNSSPGAGPVREVPSIITAAAAVGRLAAARLYRDGVLAEHVPLMEAEATIQRRLRVPGETRWITAVAVDENGFESSPQSVPLTHPENQGRAGGLFALAVGTDAYSHLAGLAFAQSDARAFVNMVRSAKGTYYRAVATDTLLNEPDLRRALRARIDGLKRKLTENDTLMIYIAGHGLRDRQGRFYLASRDTDPEEPGATAVSWDDLSGSLAALKGRVIVFLDACHAGAAATNDDAVKNLLQHQKAVTVIAASKGRQSSQERQALGGGVFTRMLSEVVVDERKQTDTNDNGALELSEVFSALKRCVVSMTSGAQTPWIARNRMVGEIPLF